MLPQQFQHAYVLPHSEAGTVPIEAMRTIFIEPSLARAGGNVSSRMKQAPRFKRKCPERREYAHSAFGCHINEVDPEEKEAGFSLPPLSSDMTTRLRKGHTHPVPGSRRKDGMGSS